ncbi:MAG: CotS family spore coat protein [Bacillota bacterium]|nr:CotS family spore coat protein [Bacillota bacterium]
MSRINHNIDIVDEKERVMIVSVLKEYNISINDILRLRSAYKIDSSAGTYFVKRMRHGIDKARNGCIFVEALNHAGFLNTAKYLRTVDGNFFVRYGKYIFYVTSWIDGHEAELEDMRETVNCVKLLAKFHVAAASIDTSALKVKNNLKNWPKIFTDQLSDLERYRNCINRKKIRNQFDNTYLDLIDFYYNRGVTALSVLNSSNYHILSREARAHRTICHDSFYYQNIMKTQDDYYLIDFDSIIIDLYVVDLGKFIRRLMYRKSYQWDFQKAKYLLEEYSKIKPVTREDMDIVLALLVFPQKFWKLGRKRYIKRKNWSEAKYMRKLNKLMKFNKEEQEFISEFIDYINSSKTINE